MFAEDVQTRGSEAENEGNYLTGKFTVCTLHFIVLRTLKEIRITHDLP